MEPILISFSIVVVGVIGAVLLFSFAMRDRGQESTLRPPNRFPASEGQFFLEGAPGTGNQAGLPSETISLQLERHFRLEEQAAAGFLKDPSIRALHAPTLSPFRDRGD